MGVFYFDESIHDQAGFILGAFTYFPKSVDSEIECFLGSLGIDPDQNEYKSRTQKSKNPLFVDVRNGIRRILKNWGRIGVVIIPREDRRYLGLESLKGLKAIIEKNALDPMNISAYFDEGIFFSEKIFEDYLLESGLKKDVKYYIEKDSKNVKGIQTADYAAHACAMRLKSRITGIEKTVKAGENSGYDPDMDIGLSFELFATLRYNMFFNGTPLGDKGSDLFTVKSTGCWISNRCNTKLRKHAESLFDTVYLGCIH